MMTQCRNVILDKEIYNYRKNQSGADKNRSNYRNVPYVKYTFDSVAHNIPDLKQINNKQI